jgi:hypothetical protein
VVVLEFGVEQVESFQGGVGRVGSGGGHLLGVVGW